MNREQKAAVIDEVAGQIRDAQAIFAVDYRGLTVRQAADLRSRLIEIDANLRVVKNTLTERAADQVGADALKQYLEGPTAFTFVNGDPVMAAKALAAFRKETQLPEFKGGWMDGKEISVAEIEALSKLPSLDVMHGQLVGLIAMPISGLARSLNALLSGIAVALGQIQEQGLVGQGAADAEAPAEEASAEAAEAPANGGDEGAASAAAAEAPADGGDEGAASAEAAEAPTDGGDEGAASAGEAASADAPVDEAAAEEIPNQPAPAPEQAADAGDETETDAPADAGADETSTEEGDN